MDRAQIEIKLNRDRAWLLETIAALAPDEIIAGVTQSEHDPGSMWSIKDHLAHLSGIERNFNAMVRRHLEGDRNAVGLRKNADGSARTMDQIMAVVHEMTEAWVVEHRSLTLDAVVALGQRTRADTLALIASLSDAQLAEKLPGAPWADGTIGGVLGVNADHGRMHWGWIKAARASA